MLVDEIREVTIKAGDGGKGKVSFGKMEKSGPDGGNGGDGGNVFIKGSSDLTLLNQFHGATVVSAEDGVPGGKEKRAGKNGEALVLQLPIGSLLTDLKTKETFELTEVGQEFLLCEKGIGGTGNFDLRSASNTTPKNTIPATPGQTRHLSIILRFLADYGLIGLPSAGKSSLLNELTNAKVKTAAYHFTTLSPNLGVLPNRKIIADIPGLIEGAHAGRGLGVRFLKHIEKVTLLLHCISADSENPLTDYETIRKELGGYSEKLLKKREIILLTKTDLLHEAEVNEKVKSLKKLDRQVIPTSIYDPASIDNLLKVL